MEMNFAYGIKLSNALSLVNPKQIAWCIAPIMESMIFCAVRHEPDVAMIHVLSKLVDSASELGDTPTYESVMQNMYVMRQTPTDDVQWRNQAVAECLRRQKLGFDKPLSNDPDKAVVEREARIVSQVAALKAKASENRQRFEDAVVFIHETLSDPLFAFEEALAEVDENVIGNFYSRIYGELEKQCKTVDDLSTKKLNPWKEMQLKEQMASSEALAKVLGTTVKRVRDSYAADNKRADEQWLGESVTDEDKAAESTVSSDNETPKEKAKRFRKAIELKPV